MNSQLMVAPILARLFRQFAVLSPPFSSPTLHHLCPLSGSHPSPCRSVCGQEVVHTCYIVPVCLRSGGAPLGRRCDPVRPAVYLQRRPAAAAAARPPGRDRHQGRPLGGRAAAPAPRRQEGGHRRQWRHRLRAGVSSGAMLARIQLLVEG